MRTLSCIVRKERAQTILIPALIDRCCVIKFFCVVSLFYRAYNFTSNPFFDSSLELCVDPFPADHASILHSCRNLESCKEKPCEKMINNHNIIFYAKQVEVGLI